MKIAVKVETVDQALDQYDLMNPNLVNIKFEGVTNREHLRQQLTADPSKLAKLSFIKNPIGDQVLASIVDDGNMLAKVFLRDDGCVDHEVTFTEKGMKEAEERNKKRQS